MLAILRLDSELWEIRDMHSHITKNKGNEHSVYFSGFSNSFENIFSKGYKYIIIKNIFNHN